MRATVMPCVLVKRLNDLIPDVTQLASLVVAFARRSRVVASELLRQLARGIRLVVS